MALEKTPSPQIGKGYVPPKSQKYHYRDGESFVTIARKFEMDPLELIQLNFGTTVPREVNWYLREYCGCTKTTRSGKNYVFSSSDRRNGEKGYIWVPRSIIEMPPVVITGRPPSGRWVGLGIKIDAGAGGAISPMYAYLFSMDRFDDRCLIFLDGASAAIGGTFTISPALVVATGVYHPMELHNLIYEGEWDLQLKLGANWGKILKYLKGTSKAAPLVNTATKIARTRLAGVLVQLRKHGAKGKRLAEVVRRAAKLSPDDWADLRTAVKSSISYFDSFQKRSDPTLDVIEIPFAPSFGAALAVSKMLAEVKVYDMELGSREPTNGQASDVAAFDE